MDDPLTYELIIHVGRLNGMINVGSRQKIDESIEALKEDGAIYVLALHIYQTIEHTFTPEFMEETFQAMMNNEYWIEIKDSPCDSPIDPYNMALTPYQRYQNAVQNCSEFIGTHRIPILR